MSLWHLKDEVLREDGESQVFQVGLLLEDVKSPQSLTGILLLGLYFLFCRNGTSKSRKFPANIAGSLTCSSH